MPPLTGRLLRGNAPQSWRYRAQLAGRRGEAAWRAPTMQPEVVSAKFDLPLLQLQSKTSARSKSKWWQMGEAWSRSHTQPHCQPHRGCSSPSTSGSVTLPHPLLHLAIESSSLQHFKVFKNSSSANTNRQSCNGLHRAVFIYTNYGFN